MEEDIQNLYQLSCFVGHPVSKTKLYILWALYAVNYFSVSLKLTEISNIRTIKIVTLFLCLLRYLDTTPVRTASVPWSGLTGALLAGSLNFQYFQTDPPASPKQLSPTTLECWRPWYLDPGLKKKKKILSIHARQSQFLFISNWTCQSWNLKSEVGGGNNN